MRDLFLGWCRSTACFHLVGLCSRASLPDWTESSELLVVVLNSALKNHQSYFTW